MDRSNIRFMLFSTLFLMASFLMPPSVALACSSRGDTTMIQLKELGRVLDRYKDKCGQYPTTEQGLKALVQEPDAYPRCIEYEKSGFIAGGRVPKDAWGEDFVFHSDGDDFELQSLGADNLAGGLGPNRDVIFTGKGEPALNPPLSESERKELLVRKYLQPKVLTMVATGIFGILVALWAFRRRRFQLLATVLVSTAFLVMVLGILFAPLGCS